eukprot:gene14363-4226_t
MSGDPLPSKRESNPTLWEDRPPKLAHVGERRPGDIDDSFRNFVPPQQDRKVGSNWTRIPEWWKGDGSDAPAPANADKKYNPQLSNRFMDFWQQMTGYDEETKW